MTAGWRPACPQECFVAGAEAGALGGGQLPRAGGAGLLASGAHLPQEVFALAGLCLVQLLLYEGELA